MRRENGELPDDRHYVGYFKAEILRLKKINEINNFQMLPDKKKENEKNAADNSQKIPEIRKDFFRRYNIHEKPRRTAIAHRTAAATKKAKEKTEKINPRPKAQKRA